MEPTYSYPNELPLPRWKAFAQMVVATIIKTHNFCIQRLNGFFFLCWNFLGKEDKIHIIIGDINKVMCL